MIRYLLSDLKQSIAICRHRELTPRSKRRLSVSFIVTDV